MSLTSAFISFVGKIFHKKAYSNFKAAYGNNLKSGMILMSGPSVELDEFNEKYNIAVCSNLTNPQKFIDKIQADVYVHCFSDPTIITNKDKYILFEKILEFSKINKDYYVLVPVQYLKYVLKLSLFPSKKMMIYNQSTSYRDNKELSFNKLMYQNLSSIYLDCALPWVSFVGCETVFVSGFDAFYGKSKNKKYSTINDQFDEVNNNPDWTELVRSNAMLLESMVTNITGIKVSHSVNSGYWKYKNEKSHINW